MKTTEDGAPSIIEGTRRGERWAEKEIVRLAQSFARHLCRGRDSSSEPSPEWEDVSAEALRRFYASGIHQFRTGGPERSYLYSLVKASRIQLYRSLSRRARRETAVAPSLVAESNCESRTFLYRVMGRLGADCRTLLERTFFDGATYPELARELGLVESSVRSRVTRCLQKAREVVRT